MLVIAEKSSKKPWQLKLQSTLEKRGKLGPVGRRICMSNLFEPCISIFLQLNTVTDVAPALTVTSSLTAATAASDAATSASVKTQLNLIENKVNAIITEINKVNGLTC